MSISTMCVYKIILVSFDNYILLDSSNNTAVYDVSSKVYSAGNGDLKSIFIKLKSGL